MAEQLKEAASNGTLGNPPPDDPGSMFEDVLKDMPGSLVMQREEMLALRKLGGFCFARRARLVAATESSLASGERPTDRP